ncbi:MAG: hypothetical protein ABSF96_09630 [Steroidobacteraceae bacterium]|jgi:hypothetical protein
MFARIYRAAPRRLTRTALVLGLYYCCSTSLAAEKVLVPQIEGNWWQVAGSPDLGQYTTEGQQPVDFAVWQAADGTWQLWSCIRATSYPGATRLFYRWEGGRLADSNWKPMGIAMTSDPSLGEMEGYLQAPYVMRYHGEFLMFYGGGNQIALAKSKDGKTFERRLMPDGKVAMFTDGVGTRDPDVLRIKGLFYLYYSANPGTALASSDLRTPVERKSLLASPNADYLRTSKDLVKWSEPTRVAFGGAAGTGPWSAECPFVYFHKASGYYYLFRTQHYGENAQTSVYRSKDPTNFGINDDRYLVETLPVAAPEIIESDGQLYIAALLPSLKGIQIAKLTWAPKT